MINFNHIPSLEMPIPCDITKNKDIGSGYIGGKGGSGVYQTIINLIPPHNVYIETHLGGASIMKHKRPAGYNIGIDVDPDVIDYWNSSQLFKNFTADQTIKNGCITSGKNFPAGNIGNDVLPWARGRNSISNGTVPIFKNNDTVPEFNFINDDAILFLKSKCFSGDEFIYCDPPYLLSTRKNRKYYKYEYTDQDHISLLEFLSLLPCSIMISGYYSDLYMKILPGWNTKSFEAQTRGGKTSTEWLWYNYKTPEKLHDYTYLGASFREREKIRNKKQRWINRLRKMPATERNGILQAFKEEDI